MKLLINLTSTNPRFVGFHCDIVKQITWKESQEVVDLVNLLRGGGGVERGLFKEDQKILIDKYFENICNE